ncbi:MAG: glycerol-3-phosphate 1-O-acyltransferase PlsY [Comamonas sp.]|nr:glycerol-3-phosphate 1-O-acyltransferase PlsY [Candidatus Comamonas equi]
MNALLPVVATVLAYLIGSLSFAVIVSSVMGLNDPRTYGSGNPGATNVLRSGSKKAAALTLLLDAVKGLVPVLLVKYFGPDYGLHEGTLALVAIGAFLGHLFPIFFKFKGGKGVATALGVLLGLSGWRGLLVLLTWLLMAFTTRYSSLAALIAAIMAPVYYVLLGGVLWDYDKSVLVAVIAMSVLLLWRHADNISRLLKGQESKTGSKKDKPAGGAAPVGMPKTKAKAKRSKKQ